MNQNNNINNNNNWDQFQTPTYQRKSLNINPRRSLYIQKKVELPSLSNNNLHQKINPNNPEDMQLHQALNPKNQNYFPPKRSSEPPTYLPKDNQNQKIKDEINQKQKDPQSSLSQQKNNLTSQEQILYLKNIIKENLPDYYTQLEANLFQYSFPESILNCEIIKNASGIHVSRFIFSQKKKNQQLVQIWLNLNEDCKNFQKKEQKHKRIYDLLNDIRDPQSQDSILHIVIASDSDIALITSLILDNECKVYQININNKTPFHLLMEKIQSKYYKEQKLLEKDAIQNKTDLDFDLNDEENDQILSILGKTIHQFFTRKFEKEFQRQIVDRFCSSNLSLAEKYLKDFWDPVINLSISILKSLIKNHENDNILQWLNPESILKKNQNNNNKENIKEEDYKYGFQYFKSVLFSQKQLKNAKILENLVQIAIKYWNVVALNYFLQLLADIQQDENLKNNELLDKNTYQSYYELMFSNLNLLLTQQHKNMTYNNLFSIFEYLLVNNFKFDCKYPLPFIFTLTMIDLNLQQGNSYLLTLLFQYKWDFTQESLLSQEKDIGIKIQYDHYSPNLFQIEYKQVLISLIQNSSQYQYQQQQQQQQQQQNNKFLSYQIQGQNLLSFMISHEYREELFQQVKSVINIHNSDYLHAIQQQAKQEIYPFQIACQQQFDSYILHICQDQQLWDQNIQILSQSFYNNNLKNHQNTLQNYHFQEKNDTFLHYIARKGYSSEQFQFFLDLGISHRSKNAQENTVIHLSLQNQHSDLSKFILQKFPFSEEFYHQNQDKETIFKYIIHYELQEIFDYILQIQFDKLSEYLQQEIETTYEISFPSLLKDLTNNYQEFKQNFEIKYYISQENITKILKLVQNSPNIQQDQDGFYLPLQQKLILKDQLHLFLGLAYLNSLQTHKQNSKTQQLLHFLIEKSQTQQTLFPLIKFLLDYFSNEIFEGLQEQRDQDTYKENHTLLKYFKNPSDLNNNLLITTCQTGNTYHTGILINMLKNEQNPPDSDSTFLNHSNSLNQSPLTISILKHIENQQNNNNNDNDNNNNEFHFQIALSLSKIEYININQQIQMEQHVLNPLLFCCQHYKSLQKLASQIINSENQFQNSFNFIQNTLKNSQNPQFIIDLLTNFTDNLTKNTFLHYSVLYNDLQLTNFLLENTSININHQNYLGHTPLHLSITQQNLSIAQLLFNYGADPLLKDSGIQIQNMYSLICSDIAYYPYTKEVEYKEINQKSALDCVFELFTKEQQLQFFDFYNFQGLSVLMHTIAKGNPEALQKIIHCYKQINLNVLQDRVRLNHIQDEILVNIAQKVKKYHLPSIISLEQLAEKCQVNLQNALNSKKKYQILKEKYLVQDQKFLSFMEGDTVFHLATIYGNVKIFEILANEAVKENLLYQAFKGDQFRNSGGLFCHDLDYIDCIIQSKIDFTDTETGLIFRKVPILFYFASQLNLESVKFIQQQGQNMNEKDENQNTVLFFLAYLMENQGKQFLPEYLEIFILLLHLGCDMFLHNYNQPKKVSTVIHYLINSSQIQLSIKKQLLSIFYQNNPQNQKITNLQGNTILYEQCLKEDIQVIQMLLEEKQLDMNQTSIRAETALLHLAQNSNNMDIFQLFSTRIQDLDISLVDIKAENLLHKLVQNHPITANNNKLKTILETYFFNNAYLPLPVLKKLLEQESVRRETVLSLAIKNNKILFVQLILENYIEKFSIKETEHFLCCKLARVEIFQLFIQYYPYLLETQDKDQRTCLFYIPQPGNSLKDKLKLLEIVASDNYKYQNKNQENNPIILIKKSQIWQIFDKNQHNLIDFTITAKDLDFLFSILLILRQNQENPEKYDQINQFFQEKIHNQNDPNLNHYQQILLSCLIAIYLSEKQAFHTIFDHFYESCGIKQQYIQYNPEDPNLVFNLNQPTLSQIFTLDHSSLLPKLTTYKQSQNQQNIELNISQDHQFILKFQLMEAIKKENLNLILLYQDFLVFNPNGIIKKIISYNKSNLLGRYLRSLYKEDDLQCLLYKDHFRQLLKQQENEQLFLVLVDFIDLNKLKQLIFDDFSQFSIDFDYLTLVTLDQNIKIPLEKQVLFYQFYINQFQNQENQEEYLNKMIDIQEKQTPLHTNAMLGNKENILQLQKNPIIFHSFNIKNSSKNHPLHEACRFQHFECVQQLILDQKIKETMLLEANSLNLTPLDYIILNLQKCQNEQEKKPIFDQNIHILQLFLELKSEQNQNLIQFLMENTDFDFNLIVLILKFILFKQEEINQIILCVEKNQLVSKEKQLQSIRILKTLLKQPKKDEIQQKKEEINEDQKQNQENFNELQQQFKKKIGEFQLYIIISVNQDEKLFQILFEQENQENQANKQEEQEEEEEQEQVEKQIIKQPIHLLQQLKLIYQDPNLLNNLIESQKDFKDLLEKERKLDKNSKLYHYLSEFSNSNNKIEIENQQLLTFADQLFNYMNNNNFNKHLEKLLSLKIIFFQTFHQQEFQNLIQHILNKKISQLIILYLKNNNNNNSNINNNNENIEFQTFKFESVIFSNQIKEDSYQNLKETLNIIEFQEQIYYQHSIKNQNKNQQQQQQNLQFQPYFFQNFIQNSDFPNLLFLHQAEFKEENEQQIMQLIVNSKNTNLAHKYLQYYEESYKQKLKNPEYSKKLNIYELLKQVLQNNDSDMFSLIISHRNFTFIEFYAQEKAEQNLSFLEILLKSEVKSLQLSTLAKRNDLIRLIFTEIYSKDYENAQNEQKNVYSETDPQGNTFFHLICTTANTPLVDIYLPFIIKASLQNINNIFNNSPLQQTILQHSLIQLKNQYNPEENKEETVHLIDLKRVQEIILLNQDPEACSTRTVYYIYEEIYQNSNYGKLMKLFGYYYQDTKMKDLLERIKNQDGNSLIHILSQDKRIIVSNYLEIFMFFDSFYSCIDYFNYDQKTPFELFIDTRKPSPETIQNIKKHLKIYYNYEDNILSGFKDPSQYNNNNQGYRELNQVKKLIDNNDITKLKEFFTLFPWFLNGQIKFNQYQSISILRYAIKLKNTQILNVLITEFKQKLILDSDNNNYRLPRDNIFHDLIQTLDFELIKLVLSNNNPSDILEFVNLPGDQFCTCLQYLEQKLEEKHWNDAELQQIYGIKQYLQENGAIENLFLNEHNIVKQFQKKGDFQTRLNLYFPLFRSNSFDQRLKNLEDGYFTHDIFKQEVFYLEKFKSLLQNNENQLKIFTKIHEQIQYIANLPLDDLYNRKDLKDQLNENKQTILFSCWNGHSVLMRLLIEEKQELEYEQNQIIYKIYNTGSYSTQKCFYIHDNSKNIQETRFPPDTGKESIKYDYQAFKNLKKQHTYNLSNKIEKQYLNPKNQPKKENQNEENNNNLSIQEEYDMLYAILNSLEARQYIVKTQFTEKFKKDLIEGQNAQELTQIEEQCQFPFSLQEFLRFQVLGDTFKYRNNLTREKEHKALEQITTVRTFSAESKEFHASYLNILRRQLVKIQRYPGLMASKMLYYEFPLQQFKMRQDLKLDRYKSGQKKSDCTRKSVECLIYDILMDFYEKSLVKDYINKDIGGVDGCEKLMDEGRNLFKKYILFKKILYMMESYVREKDNGNIQYSIQNSMLQYIVQKLQNAENQEDLPQNIQNLDILKWIQQEKI